MKKEFFCYYEKEPIEVFHAYRQAASQRFKKSIHAEEYWKLSVNWLTMWKYNMNAGACEINLIRHGTGTAVCVSFSVAQLYGARFDTCYNDMNGHVAAILGTAPQSVQVKKGMFLRKSNKVFLQPNGAQPGTQTGTGANPRPAASSRPATSKPEVEAPATASKPKAGNPATATKKPKAQAPHPATSKPEVEAPVPATKKPRVATPAPVDRPAAGEWAEKLAPFVFLSYAHKNSDCVLPMFQSLQAAGVPIWYDAGIHAGSEWEEEIIKNLSRSSAFIFFVSEASLASQNCRDELYQARKKNKKFINILIEDIDFSKPEYEWFDFRYARYQQIPAYAMSEQEVIDKILHSFGDEA